jgi:heme-binding HmuY-like protein
MIFPVQYRLVGSLCLGCLLLLLGCGQGPTGGNDSSATVYQPTPPRPQEVGARLIGPIVYTVDARSKEIWMYFDFSQGSVVAVQDPKTNAWDLAFQRYVIKTNGGDTQPTGQGALYSLGGRDFASVRRVPDNAIFVGDVRPKNRLSSYNPVLEKWYNYSYLANVLAPKPVVYIVRTHDGKYAKMRLLSYYCQDHAAGCMTFEYVYQGDGSPNLAIPSSQVSQHLEHH